MHQKAAIAKSEGLNGTDTCEPYLRKKPVAVLQKCVHLLELFITSEVGLLTEMNFVLRRHRLYMIVVGITVNKFSKNSFTYSHF